MYCKNVMMRASHIAYGRYGKTLAQCNARELNNALSLSLMDEISEAWKKCDMRKKDLKRVYYFSAEYLIGRVVQNNILCLENGKELIDLLDEAGVDLGKLEDVEDAALGNGGLGRLAACLLDSAATLGIPLDGYGIRYRYGLFKQTIKDGFQKESADDWSKFGDPWSIRRDSDTVRVDFADESVLAVPYDMPVIGFHSGYIGTLRLWQSEPIEPFDFERFNDGEYDKSVAAKNRAEDLSRVLYPNDHTPEGRLLRLKQQYFFSSASIRDIVKNYLLLYGDDFSRFGGLIACQLNDTHPVVAIPELIRVIMDEHGINFDTAFRITQSVFSYTNHTVMQEALEKWPREQMARVSPRVLEIIERIDRRLGADKARMGWGPQKTGDLLIISGQEIHMANMAAYSSHCVNGVAEIHTKILKESVFKNWYSVFPERFQNITNGITQRRWLMLCNKELSSLITELLGNDKWMTDLCRLKELERFAKDDGVLDRFADIKLKKHIQLAQYIKKHENVIIDPESLLDAQVKRIHEYKRQLMNILSILWIYEEIKDGNLKDFQKTTFIFSGKAAPGYTRAKAVIKLINETARLINADAAVRDKIQVVFVQNYNVSYAEKIVAAADVSEQISTAGTEASGTGNMKFMLNGAVTLGTLDGANIEIVKEAGAGNNYIFGARIEDIERIIAGYDPKDVYMKNEKIRRTLHSLIDGTLDDGGSGAFRNIYDSLLEGDEFQQADRYFVLHDLPDYVCAKLEVNRLFKNKREFARKCFINMCSAGRFSSDRTVAEYARLIWRVKSI